MEDRELEEVEEEKDGVQGWGHCYSNVVNTIVLCENVYIRSAHAPTVIPKTKH